jgi:hypothetical protein
MQDPLETISNIFLISYITHVLIHQKNDSATNATTVTTADTVPCTFQHARDVMWNATTAISLFQPSLI